MAGSVGRENTLEKNNVVIAGVRTVTLTWGGSSIDITSGEDDGHRLLLEASGQEQVDIKFDGISKDEVFLAIALGSGSKMLTDITYNLATGSSISGDFRLSSFELSDPYNDAQTFSATLESSGVTTYTPAP